MDEGGESPVSEKLRGESCSSPSTKLLCVNNNTIMALKIEIGYVVT